MYKQTLVFTIIAALPLAFGVAGCSIQLADSKSMDPLDFGVCPPDFQSECATASVPLDWDKPDGEWISVFVSRQPAKNAPAKAQLWLLSGGPAASGGLLHGLIVDKLAPLLPDFDFYILENRGVGESTRLGCPAQEAPESDGGTSITPDEWDACLASVEAEWGDGLRHFSTTADARDLGWFIDHTRKPGQKTFVYGVSYGTYRAMRFLDVRPDGADGVILDSILSPGIGLLSHYDEQYDPVAMDLAKLCADDPVCGQKLGANPWAAITSAYAKIRQHQCPALDLRDGDLKHLMSRLIESVLTRPYIFPLVYRINRCEQGDVQVLTHFTEAFGELQKSHVDPLNRASFVLLANIAFSELWEVPAPSSATIEQRCANAYFCPGVGQVLQPIADRFPRYMPDEYTRRWPTTKVPILGMNGTLDPQTPYAEAQAARDHFHGPHQHFVGVPWSPHVVFANSPVKTAGALPCGAQMMLGFLGDPTAPVDTTCTQDLVPVRFHDDAFDSRLTPLLFGSNDPWENAANM